MKSKLNLRYAHYLVIALFALMAVAVSVSAGDVPPASNCSGSSCTIEADHPVNMRVCPMTSGPVGWQTFSGVQLDQGGQCSTASFWVINSGGSSGGIYRAADVAPYVTVYRDPAGQYAEQHLYLTKYGEEVHLLANYTLVKNGTLIHYKLDNHGSSPWEIGWKYSWDLHLNNLGTPPIFVDNRPGDGEGPAGTYDQVETDFGLSHDIKYVKVWQTRNGPDKASDLKAYFWWDPLYGGTPPDLLQYMNSGRAIGGSSSWMYTLSSSPVSSDNEFQTYFGWPDLIELAPNDGKPGGKDEAEYFIWYGTGIPDPLIRYGITGQFANRPADQTSSTTFIDAGETAVFPLTVTSTTGLGSDGAGEYATTVEFASDVVELPNGWEYEIIDADTGKAVETATMSTGESRNLLLKVQAPTEAYGNDAARINFRALLADRPSGAYDRANSQFEAGMFTTTIVRPNYGLEMIGDENVPAVKPGETAEFEISIKNRGNLRDDIPVAMDIASGLGLGWGLTLDPPTYMLGRDESQTVRVSIDIPVDEFGGERTLVARATVPEQNQFNTTVLKMRILTDSFIEIIPDLDEIILAPGGTTSFEALVINHGFEEELIDIHGAADAIVGLSEGSDPGNWDVEVETDGFEEALAPGGSKRFPITVRAPEDALAGEQKNILLFATKQDSTNKLDERLVQAVVGRTSLLELDSVIDVVRADPGLSMEYQVLVRNVGNSLENLTVELDALPAGWEVQIVPNRFELDVGQLQPVKLVVESTDLAGAGRYDLGVIVKNADQAKSASLPLRANINQIYGADITTERNVIHKLPSDTLDLLFAIENRGNDMDAFLLDGFPSNWDVEVDPAITPQLAPGESTVVRVQGRIVGDVGQYVAPLSAVSVSSGTTAGEGGITVFVARPDLLVREVEVSSPARHVGDLEVIQAIIENAGGIEAPNVEVALFVDGEDSGIRVQFDRAAPGQELVASLPWPSKAGSHEYRVVVDPENIHDEGNDESNNQVTIRSDGSVVEAKKWLGPNGSFAEKATPPLGIPLAIVGLALLARRRQF
ncbi:MAG: CARDB domain-containing protein [Thermoplasmatota archaeon]